MSTTQLPSDARQTSESPPDAAPEDVEREFIRGNRDGPNGRSETYTVCRLQVSQERLDKEMKLGLHSHFVTLAKCWSCPAHIFLKAEKKYRKRRHERGAGDQALHSPPAVANLENWCKSSLISRPSEALEIIQKDPHTSGTASTYTICRIAVPRERMVSEVLEELHPGYHVRRAATSGCDAKGFTTKECQRLYVKGNPTEPFDNVDYPKSRKASPGFSPRELCPFRLLGPGSQLRESLR